MIGKVLFDEMRDRRQIKNKHQREEKENPWAVEAAMNRRDPMPTPPTSSPSTDGDGSGGRLLTSVDDGEGFAAEDPEPEEWTVAAVVGEAQEDMVMEKGQEQNLARGHRGQGQGRGAAIRSICTTFRWRRC